MPQIADDSGWTLLDRGGRLETLDRGECRRLLDSTNIGRLAYCTDIGPRILPMNYTVVGDALIFRTGMDTEASAT
jgi:nitroimidazol reductase NimA-like FMN-containing flavoprotein (pyridoxamine 5'-phosphate oxidase superfamily)